MNLFDPKDYQSITIDIIVKNLTSGLPIEVLPAGPDSKDEAFQIQLIEFRDKGVVVFGFPKNTCSNGHNLSITLTVKDYQEVLQTSFTAKVLTVENDQSSFATVSVQLVQYEKEEWDRFLSIYAKRQQEILGYFDAVKGEA